MTSKVPIIKPIKQIEYATKQHEYQHIMYKLPVRSLICGPSGTGKTVLLTSLMLNIYRGCFEKIKIWSSSINLDKTCEPVKEYCKTHL